MQYTYLGHTGVKVSRLCLGCMSYGNPQWRPWVLDEQAAMPFFRKAVEAGINFFDTADVYSLGASEEITGKALREYAKLEQVVLATKVFGDMGEGPNMKGLSRKHIQQGCEASLRRLGVETIDLYQVHRFDPHTPLDETLSALDLLVRQGKVRYLGASSMAAWKFAQALSLSERNGWARFVTHAEPLQPDLPGGRAGDDPPVPGRGHRRDPLVAVGPWPSGGHAQDARRQDGHRTGGQRRLRLEALRPSRRHRSDAGMSGGGGSSGRAARPGGHRLAPVQTRCQRADHRRDEDRTFGGGAGRRSI